MRFQVNQIIYYLLDNKVQSAPVRSRIKVENDSAFESAKDSILVFGQTRIKYATKHGIFGEEEVAISKAELLTML